VPPAAIRAKLQRHPGRHERIDLVFSWPELSPPNKPGMRDNRPIDEENATAALAEAENDRLFVTIVGLAGVLSPLERLRTIYPRYLGAQAAAGPDGLAVLPFRSGTPYDGEDFIYPASNPEQFSPAVRARPVRFRAPASASARSTARKSPSAFRATG
jgi:hypothetical protein